MHAVGTTKNMFSYVFVYICLIARNRQQQWLEQVQHEILVGGRVFDAAARTLALKGDMLPKGAGRPYRLK